MKRNHLARPANCTRSAPSCGASGVVSIALLLAAAFCAAPAAAVVVLAASVLPTTRAVVNGETATVFVTIINAGDETGHQCGIAGPATSVDAEFFYQTTDPLTNFPVGLRDEAVDIAAGTAQTFVIGLTPSSTFDPTEVPFNFVCADSAPVGLLPGINTLSLASSDEPTPDVVAFAATVSNDGFVVIDPATGAGAFAVATANVGAGGQITVTADTGGAVIPIALSLCQTDTATGACAHPSVPGGAPVELLIEAGATRSFAIFVAGSEAVAEDAARHRVFVRLRDDEGIVRGSTSVAVKTGSAAATRVIVKSVPLPTTGFVPVGEGLVSPGLPLDIPADTVAFNLQMQGSAVRAQNDPPGIDFVVQGPDGAFAAASCGVGLCTLLRPGGTPLPIVPGTYEYVVFASADDIDSIDLTDASLAVVLRSGPLPDVSATIPATLAIRPFHVGTEATSAEIAQVMAELRSLFVTFGVDVLADAPVRITDPRFASVSDQFTDPTTAELVRMGRADRVNLFFVDALGGAGAGATLGIAPGIPGPMGIVSSFSGVLLSVDAHRVGAALDVRTLVATTAHEMGHFLGLEHTSHPGFALHDAIDDTPACVAADDVNSNEVADPEECPDGANLMFWTTATGVVQETLSEGQKTLVWHSPVAEPSP